MGDFSREDLRARYHLFDRFALEDQRQYYKVTTKRHERASGQVNRLRAMISLITGLASALAGVIAGVYYIDGGACSVNTLPAGEILPSWCGGIQAVVIGTIIISIALPAIGGFFNTLADLYQWDKLTNIYNSAVKNINVADALSPDDESPDEEYIAHLYAYVEGTLQVMSDETAQWGQNIREPQVTTQFIQQAEVRAAHMRNNFADLEGAGDDSGKGA